MRTAVLFLALLVLFPFASASGQSAETGTADWYSSRAKDAISQSNYETAVNVLTEAKRKFPNAPKLNLELADLYYDKELYSLALGEYREAESKGSEDFHTLNQISLCYGKLNRDKDSIDYLNKVLALFPDSVETIDDLGWMYFKTYQMEKGEKILLEGIRKFGMQRDMAMTLATIYSGMNRYEDARRYYLKSIDDAAAAGDRYFASVAYYNLSLLEHNFYHYNSALAFTEDSISMEDRASGHLARGELFESRMDYGNALQEYEKSFDTDNTPLSRVNLAILYQRFGSLELSRRYAEEAMGTTDLAWMLYYGTDTSRHFKDIHEILADVYEGLSRIEATRPTAGLFDRVKALFTSMLDRVLSWYHRERFRVYSLAIGKEYMAEGRWEEACGEFYRANTQYREVAASYLAKAKALETARTPHAASFYQLEEGKLGASIGLLSKSISGFDPFWEREPMADSLAAMIRLLGPRGNTVQRREALNRLFEINPGAFRQNGFGLPLVLNLDSSLGKREKGLIVRYLKRAGSELFESAEGSFIDPPEGFHYAVSLSIRPGGEAGYVITDLRSGRVLVENSSARKGGMYARSAALVQGLLDDLFRVQ
jgi:tetratricopeptide (TPR) repeat protein